MEAGKDAVSKQSPEHRNRVRRRPDLLRCGLYCVRLAHRLNVALLGQILPDISCYYGNLRIWFRQQGHNGRALIQFSLLRTVWQKKQKQKNRRAAPQVTLAHTSLVHMETGTDGVKRR